jgi:hypothetical protein
MKCFIFPINTTAAILAINIFGKRRVDIGDSFAAPITVSDVTTDEFEAARELLAPYQVKIVVIGINK